MDEDKPNTDSDETWRYVFASAFVFSCCNSLRESVLRALWDIQVLKMFHGTKSMICSLWWQILIRKYCEGYSSSTGLKLCTNTWLVPLLKKKKTFADASCFQLPWLNWTKVNLSSHRVRIQVQRMNWYFPPILARLILWWGGNKMEVD